MSRETVTRCDRCEQIIDNEDDRSVHITASGPGHEYKSYDYCSKCWVIVKGAVRKVVKK